MSDFLAQADDGNATLWPREHHPSADDAIRAHLDLCDGWYDVAEDEGYRIRLAWASPADEPGWWSWTFRAKPPWLAVECWCLERAE